MKEETIKKISELLSEVDYRTWQRIKIAIDKKYSSELTKKNNKEKLDTETILNAIKFELNH